MSNNSVAPELTASAAGSLTRRSLTDTVALKRYRAVRYGCEIIETRGARFMIGALVVGFGNE